MLPTRTRLLLPVALVALALPAGARGQAPPAADNPYPYTAGEPKAAGLSLARSAEYLDGVAEFWMRPNACGACHANFAYLMARPLLGGEPSPRVAVTRQFLENRKKGAPGFVSDAEAAGIAFALAWDDARTGGKLQPATRQALRRMWAVQKSNGSWNPMGCGEVMPPETDRYYTIALAALAVGVAPEGYARTTEAQDGLTKLRRFLVKTPAENLHNEAMLLWASGYTDGLMTTTEREATVQALLTAQERDGGWSFAAISSRPRPAPGSSSSDGYGTAFAVYVLRQAGVPATRAEIVRGVNWLRSNQRASGRWFTPAPVSPTEGNVGSRDLYAQNLGTAFAVLALKACDGTARPLTRAPGLALRDRLIPD